MLKYTKDDFIDVDLFEERLNNHHIYMDKDLAELIRDYDIVQYSSAYKAANRIMMVQSGGDYILLNKDNIINFLMEFHYVDSSKFFTKKVKGASLNKDKVLVPLLADGIAVEFLEAYCRYKTLGSNNSTMRTILDSLIKTDLKTNDGATVYRCNYKVNRQFNLRFAYKENPIINIPRQVYDECIVVPDGYVMASADFQASDFRIAYTLFIRDERNATIMDSCSDKYEGMARIIADFYGEKFDINKFKDERKIYKVCTLATIYGQTKGKTVEETKFIKKFSRYLDTCPRYVEFRKRLEEFTKLGLNIQVESYFGHRENIAYVPYDTVGMINTALNSPIQTGTSEIVIHTTNNILDRFYSMGYTKDDIRVYYTRHDELIFIMKEEVMKDSWVLKDCSDIIVDNWTPLKLKFEFTRRYNVPDENLTKLYEYSCKRNEDKLTIIEPSKDYNIDWYPIQEVLKLSCSTCDVPEDKELVIVNNKQTGDHKCLILDDSSTDNILKVCGYTQLDVDQNNLTIVKGKSILALYNTLNDSCAYHLLPNSDNETVEGFLNSLFADRDEKLYESGYRYSRVLYKCKSADEYYNTVFVKFEYNPNTTEVAKSDLASEYMLYSYIEYAKKCGCTVDYKPSSFLESNWKVVKNMGKFIEMQ